MITCAIRGGRGFEKVVWQFRRGKYPRIGSYIVQVDNNNAKTHDHSTTNSWCTKQFNTFTISRDKFRYSFCDINFSGPVNVYDHKMVQSLLLHSASEVGLNKTKCRE